MSAVFFLEFLVIRTLDSSSEPDPDPDSLIQWSGWTTLLLIIYFTLLLIPLSLIVCWPFCSPLSAPMDPCSLVVCFSFRFRPLYCPLCSRLQPRIDPSSLLIWPLFWFNFCGVRCPPLIPWSSDVVSVPRGLVSSPCSYISQKIDKTAVLVLIDIYLIYPGVSHCRINEARNHV